jgi:WD40 repeat protein
MGFDRSSKTILTFDEGGNLKLWDVSSGTSIKLLGTFKYPFYDSASLSPKGDLAAVAGASSIVIYDTATGSVVQDIKQDTSKVKSVDGMVFSPDGNSIISEESTWSGSPSFIAEWDAATGKLLKEVGVGQDQYWINLSPDGLHLISGSFNPGQIRLWNTSTWKVLESWPDDGFGNSRQQFSPNGQYIAFVTANGAVQLIRTITGSLTETLFSTADNWVSFTPNGWFVSSDNVRNQLRIQTAGGTKALDPLVQRNRLDTLAAVNGITSEGLAQPYVLIRTSHSALLIVMMEV